MRQREMDEGKGKVRKEGRLFPYSFLKSAPMIMKTGKS